MNLGNVIQLILFMGFVGCGAYAGQELVGGMSGLLLGAAAGFTARLGVGFLAGHWPPCECGADDVSGFDLVERAGRSPVWKCRQCGRSWILQRRDWIEVLEDDSQVRRMRQRILGRWKRVSER
jgi:hypothetical protein